MRLLGMGIKFAGNMLAIPFLIVPALFVFWIIWRGK